MSTSPRALVIDDSRAVRMILRRTLAELGYEVAEAGTVAEGLAQLDELEGLELALVDWHLPGADGVEFVRAVRADPAHADLSLVLVTSESDLAHVAGALEAGVDEYVMKPFTATVIAEKLALLGLPRR